MIEVEGNPFPITSILSANPPPQRRSYTPANLNRIQNADGSWTGHHCITGRTFCTSAAVMVLMIDRAPVPASVLNKAELKK